MVIAKVIYLNILHFFYNFTETCYLLNKNWCHIGSNLKIAIWTVDCDVVSVKISLMFVFFSWKTSPSEYYSKLTKKSILIQVLGRTKKKPYWAKHFQKLTFHYFHVETSGIDVGHYITLTCQIWPIWNSLNIYLSFSLGHILFNLSLMRFSNFSCFLSEQFAVKVGFLYFQYSSNYHIMRNTFMIDL